MTGETERGETPRRLHYFGKASWNLIALYVFTDWPSNEIKELIKALHKPLSRGSDWGPDTKLKPYLRFVMALLFILFIIGGSVCQSLTCSSRIYPYANLKQDSTMNNTNCRLICEIDNKFLTSFLIPNFVIICVSVRLFWKRFVRQKKLIYKVCNLVCNLVSKLVCNFVYDLADDQAEWDQAAADRLPILKYTAYSLAYIALSLFASGLYQLVVLEALYLGTGDDTDKWQSLIDKDTNYARNYVQYYNIFYTFSFLGYVALDILYIQVIMGYAYRCQVIINEIIKSEDLQLEGQTDDAVIEMLKKFNKHIRKLDQKGRTTGIVIIIAGFATINCIINFFQFRPVKCSSYLVTEEGNSHALYTAIRLVEAVAIVLRVILWVFIALFPIYQAGEVNTAVDKVALKLILDKRDHKTVKYITSQSKAKLVGLPVNPWLTHSFYFYTF